LQKFRDVRHDRARIWNGEENLRRARPPEVLRLEIHREAHERVLVYMNAGDVVMLTHEFGTARELDTNPSERRDMTRTLLLWVLTITCSVVFLSANGQVEEKSMPAPPPARKIPGINAEDRFPGGCVDCHLNYTDMKMDTRISTLMKQWTTAVDPKLLAKAQATAPSGMTLKGKHPNVDASLKDIPSGCLKCHAKGSKTAPPFSRMLHAFHLSGGEENHFMTMFQGECTHCHKIDVSTGEWSMRSGPEK